MRDFKKFEALDESGNVVVKDDRRESDRRADDDRRAEDRRGEDRRAAPHRYGTAAQFWDNLVEEYKEERRQSERRAHERRLIERRRDEQRMIDATLGGQKPGDIAKR